MASVVYPLRIVTIPEASTAFGVAARLSMVHPAFARRSFGEWAQVLEGQARRGQQVFVLDATDRAVGFAGYALSPLDVAEGWVTGGRSPTHAECLSGDCVIFNAWIAEDLGVHRFMWNEARALVRDKRAVFFKRFYPDGRTRRTRLTITSAIEGHIGRAGAAAASGLHA